MAWYVFGNKFAVNREHAETAIVTPVSRTPVVGEPFVEYDIQIRTRSGYSTRIVTDETELNKFLEWLRT